MKINALVIDDDADSRLIISNYIAKNFPEITVEGEAGSVEESLQLINATNASLLLLDISLPDGTGFDLLKQLPANQFEVIFITAHDNFAIEAFRFSAIDYLLKPIAYPQLKAALNKVAERVEEKYFKNHWLTLAHNLQNKNLYERRLAIATGNGYLFTDVKEIVRLESQSNYTYFYLSDGKKLLSSHTLGYYEELLPMEKFCRIHNSYIVNIDFIDRYSKEGVGGVIVMKDGTELNVSQRRREDFFKHLLKKS